LLALAASAKDLDDATEALNQLVMQEGPFAGSVAEEIPEEQAAEEMAEVGDDSSDEPAPVERRRRRRGRR
jgi:hypothetical protein